MNLVKRVTELIGRITRRHRRAAAAGDRRARAALAAVVAVCMTVTAFAVTGAGSTPAGMKFIQSGHLIYNSTLGTVFHIDGGTKNIDGQVPVPGATPGSQVVQTDKSGFVLAEGSTIEFGKSDLQVADPLPAPAAERPVGLEAAGAAYAVYRQAGKIQRFGENPALESVDSALGQPVVTSTGTLWVHRINTGEICQLPLQADRLACAAKLSAGHTGALTLVGDQPVFVDTTAKELRSIDSDGLGRAVSFAQLDVAPASLVAPNDVAGRVAMINPDKLLLQLVDATPLTSGKPAAPPVVKKLRPGKYEQIASSGNGLALIDATNDTLVTLDRNGDERTLRKIPPPSKQAKTGPQDRPGLFRGGDSRLYVDSQAGEHVMVVEGNGDVTEVEVAGPVDKPGDEVTPTPTEPTEKTTPPPSEPTQPTTKPTTKPEDKPSEPADPPETDDPPEPDRPDKPEPTRKPSEPTPTEKPTVQASKPGAPGSVSAKAGDKSAVVSWGAAAPNGAPVTSYVVTWTGGSRSLGGSARNVTVTGLTNGQSYVFTVRAANRVGSGTGVSSARITLGAVADAPGGLKATGVTRAVTLSWKRPDLNGGSLVRYTVTQGGTVRNVSSTSYRWTGLTNGQSYTFQVRAVTKTSDGRQLISAPATGSASPEAPPATLQISHGAAVDKVDSDCPEGESGCAYIQLNARNLTPGVTYTFRAFASGRGEMHAPGYQLQADANGRVSTPKFHNSAVGQRIYVTVTGPGVDITSNTITWPDG